MKKSVASLLFCLFAAFALSAADVRQVFRPERFSRGNGNVAVVDPIDTAAWVWRPGSDGESFTARGAQLGPGIFLKFRKRFSALEGKPLRLDVSADERFVLLLDGREIARGPHRGLVQRWNYQSYEIALEPGEHVMEAVVWRVGAKAPLAQLTFRGGFILHAEGDYDAQLTTGKAAWTVATLANTKMTDYGKSFTYGAGSGAQCEVVGTSFWGEEPSAEAFKPVVVVRAPLHPKGQYGGFANGWLLVPTTLPDQMHERKTPGAIVRGSDVLKPGTVIPAQTRLKAYWDLGDYYCAYPDLRVSGGKGAVVKWGWTESLRDKHGQKGDRAAFDGKEFTQGMVDTFRCDGRADARFTVPWWRCGRWCLIEIETGDAPLTLDRVEIIETRYPVPPTASFECDDPTLAAVQKICVRGMQMCMHETFFDCPYYEQQMYPGDSRVQFLTVGALNGDDRLIRYAISHYDFDRRENGMIAMNSPTRLTQESATYTLCWLLMFRDYLMNHTHADWLKARLPGMVHTLMNVALYENDDGLLVNLPGWAFMDWVPAWDKARGVAPDGAGDRPSALNNLLYLHAIQSAVETADACGMKGFADDWRAKAQRLGETIRAKFWDAGRGLVADTLAKDVFSEHAQCLALLADILPPADRDRAFKGLIEAKDLSRTTVYFSHYLFDTYIKFGRADLFLKRLDLWRTYVKMNLVTPLESPGANARSDCHAWGSHPLYHLHTGVAGVKSAAPFFAKVRIAPQPGGLAWLRAKTPHPQGLIETDLSFADGGVKGTVTLPGTLTGTFEWKGTVVPLKPGRQNVSIGCSAEAGLARLQELPWIGDGRAAPTNAADFYAVDPAPKFKTEFVLPPGQTTARVRIACAGYCFAELNGRAMRGSDVMSLWSPFDQTVYADELEFVPEAFRPWPQTNTLTVCLGNGFYNLPPLAFWGSLVFRDRLAHGRPCFKVLVDGVERPLAWTWRDTHIVRNCVYLGTEIDKTRVVAEPWRPASVVSGPKGTVVARRSPAVVAGRARSGRARWLDVARKIQVIDFGENRTATTTFDFRGQPKGTRIEIVYGERLNADGSVNVRTQTAGQIKRGNGGPGAPRVACQRDVYVCGDGSRGEVFRSWFSWHVFRYAEVRGCDRLLDGPADAVATPVMSALQTSARAASFKPARPEFAQLHDICRRTFLAHTLGGVPSDCPGRERLGYGGDIVATCEAFMLNWDMREFYLKTLQDFADEAAGDGWITETAPYVGIADRGFGGRSGPVSWAVVVPVLMDALIRHYPDVKARALAFYPVCARYVDLLDRKCPSGLVPDCIGDHESLDRAPNAVTATAHWQTFVRLTASFAEMLGKADEARRFRDLADKIKAAFQTRFVKDGVVANGSQSAQSIALYLGLVPEAQRAAAERALLVAIEKADYGPTTGIFSTRYMLMYLSEHGRRDVAEKIVLHKGFPGWLHMIDRGATTLWETWRESDDVYSSCHPMFGSVDEWILRFGAAHSDGGADS